MAFDVGRWLSANGLEQYLSNFTSNGITSPDVIITLTTEEVRDAMAVTNLGDRKRILQAAKKLRKGLAATTNSDGESSSEEEETQQTQLLYTFVDQNFAGGLCGCFSDLSTCLCSFCCPWIQFGLNAAELNRRKSHNDSEACCKGFAAGLCCFMITVPFWWLMSCIIRPAACQGPVRAALRKHLGMRVIYDADCAFDDDCCVTFGCPCCAIAQEARALKQSAQH